MTLLSKLTQWVNEHPEEAQEPFMNVTTQRKLTLLQLLEALQIEEETGVAIVDEELLQLKQNAAEWLE